MTKKKFEDILYITRSRISGGMTGLNTYFQGKAGAVLLYSESHKGMIRDKRVLDEATLERATIFAKATIKN